MAELHIQLYERLRILEVTLAKVPCINAEKIELKRLFVGLFILEMLSTNDQEFDRRKVNKVLSSDISNGYSWYSALKFLSGKRAREIFILRIDIVREIGGSNLVQMFNRVLPTIGEVLSAYDDKAIKMNFDPINSINEKKESL